MIKELNEQSLENVNGGVIPVIFAVLGTDNGNKISVTHNGLPKINPDEKYVMTDAAPTAADIVSELKS